MNKRFLVYILRWQLSSVVLAPVIWMLPNQPITAAIFANFIGALIFFPIDTIIFKKGNKEN